MASYPEHLKLEFDPFEAHRENVYFYPGAGRQSILDQLVELCSYSSEPGVVTGPLGSGKSTLAYWLAQSLDDEYVPVLVRSSLFMSEVELLEAICRTLQLEGLERATSDQLRSLITGYSASLTSRSRTLILIIDDAHELGEVVLRSVLDLIESQRDTAGLDDDGIKAVFLGEPLLASAVAHQLPGGSVGMELMPLSEAEISEYIEFKLASAGYRGRFPIDLDDLQVIEARSNGVPGVIDALVRDSLPRAGDVRHTLPLLNFPERHLVAASGLFAVLLVVLFFIFGNPPDESAPLPEVASVEPGNGRVQIALPLDTDPSDQAADTTPAAALLEPALDATTETEPAADPAPVMEPAAEPVLPATLLVDAESAPVLSTSEEVPVPGASDPTPASVVQVAAPSDTANQNVIEGARLRSVTAEGYTLQLLGSYSEENVRNFIARNTTSGGLAYFESTFQERPWFVVVYGTFPSRGDAREAIDQLPAELQELEPWARSLADVQADLLRHR